MGYRAYHKETTRYLANHPKVKTKVEYFATAAAAKAAITREHKRGAICASNFAVASVTDFIEIEKTVTVQNLMSGADVVQSVNTPRSCDPSSELYWSM
jgi:hypothetical protein